MDRETIKAITRPGITVLLVISCVVILLLKALGYTDMDVPDWLIAMTSGSVGWWFSDRTRKNASEEKKNGGQL